MNAKTCLLRGAYERVCRLQAVPGDSAETDYVVKQLEQHKAQVVTPAQLASCNVCWGQEEAGGLCANTGKFREDLDI